MDSSESRRTRWLICLALVVVVIGVYWRVSGFDFINYDDPDYVTENAPVKAGLTPAGIVWAFTHFHAANWHPLTWISHMADCQFFGLNAGRHHLMNVAFHAANAVLLFLFLVRLTGAQWRSAIIAALFALHPMHVESVAWISERKDVLSTFFGLLALLAYVRCVKEPGGPPASKRQGAQKSKLRRWQVWPLIFFALSLMAKPMLVTLPFVLLLLDFWPLQRVQNAGWRTFVSPQFGKLVWEKKIWFVLVAGSSVVTFFAQKTGGAIVGTEHFPLTWRVANVFVAYFLYLAKACWPFGLSIFYPIPPAQPLWLLLTAIGFLAVISAVAAASIRRRPFLLVGWLWFLGTLVPVIGLVQVGSQQMADRYTYMPLVGLFIAIVWGAAELMHRAQALRVCGAVATVGVLVFFGWLTLSQLQYWQNSLKLFTQALAVTRDNAPANNNMGTALVALGRKAEALPHYAEAARIQPGNPLFQDNYAAALAAAGQPDAAIEHYLAAISDDPNFAKAYSNLGAVLLEQHHLDEALKYLNQAVKVDPNNAKARNNLGNALSTEGKLEDALVQYAESVRLNPANASVHLNQGVTLLRVGRVDEAEAEFSEAVRLNPALAEAHFELGRQLFMQGKFSPALEHLEQAVALKRNYAAAAFYEGAVLGEMARFDEAIAVANQALESAQRAGQAALVARIQESLESYKSHQPYRPTGPKGNK